MKTILTLIEAIIVVIVLIIVIGARKEKELKNETLVSVIVQDFEEARALKITYIKLKLDFVILHNLLRFYLGLVTILGFNNKLIVTTLEEAFKNSFYEK